MPETWFFRSIFAFLFALSHLPAPIRQPHPLAYKPLHFEYIYWGACSDERLACTQKRLCAPWKKIGEYKWDMEMTTEADTADMEAAGADAAEAVAASAVAADMADHAK